jgi:alpha-L-arabinofuranosidase
MEIKADPLAHAGESVPVVDAIATVDDSGKRWSIAMVNRHPDADVACTVKVKDQLVEGTCMAVVLSGDSPGSYNDVASPNRVVPKRTNLRFARGVAIFPPHSLTIVKVRLK